MKARLSVLTLAVDDLEKSLAFYRDGLGFTTKGIIGTQFEHGAVVFFALRPGLQLALWPRASLQNDCGLAPQARDAFSVSLGHNVHSRDEVDAVMAQAERAGARIVKPAHATFWGGYGGYFQDPDGHLWEVVCNPAFEIVD
jgi:hypothetical protein